MKRRASRAPAAVAHSHVCRAAQIPINIRCHHLQLRPGNDITTTRAVAALDGESTKLTSEIVWRGRLLMGSFGWVRKRGGNKAALVKEKMVVKTVFVCAEKRESAENFW